MSQSVLVVDDDHDIQHLIKMILVPPAYEVTSAENGAAALEQFLTGATPDILLLDLMMPNMTGYTLLNQLYERGLHSSVAIVVMSADVLTRQQIIKLGVKGFLTKPFNVSDLEHMLKQLSHS